MQNFLEITSNDSWFKSHPEKIAGVEYETTSFYFPIMVKGTKDDVLRVTGMLKDDTFAKIASSNRNAYAEKQDNSRTPIELLRIIENGLQVSGVTTIDFEDNFQTLIYGTKITGTIVSVIGKEVDVKADYDFEKRNYVEEKSKDFDAEIKETEQGRLPYSEKVGIIKMLNSRKKHLPVIEKIILPFYEYHLGVNPDKEQRIFNANANANENQLKTWKDFIREPLRVGIPIYIQNMTIEELLKKEKIWNEEYNTKGISDVRKKELIYKIWAISAIIKAHNKAKTVNNYPETDNANLYNDDERLVKLVEIPQNVLIEKKREKLLKKVENLRKIVAKYEQAQKAEKVDYWDYVVLPSYKIIQKPYDAAYNKLKEFNRQNGYADDNRNKEKLFIKNNEPKIDRSDLIKTAVTIAESRVKSAERLLIEAKNATAKTKAMRDLQTEQSALAEAKAYLKLKIDNDQDKEKRIRIANANAKARIRILNLENGQLGVSIDTERFKKMTVMELKDFTVNYYETYLKGKKVAIENDLKEVLLIGNTGRKLLKPMYSEKVAVLEHLEELIKNSTYNNFGKRKTTDSINVLGFLNFKSKITIDNVKRHVRISIVLYKNRETHLKNYEIGKKEEKSGNSIRAAQ